MSGQPLSTDLRIAIDIDRQWLSLLEQGRVVAGYPISSAKSGCGEQMNSFRTPTGLHAIRLKIGEGEPVGRVFVGRRSTGEIYSPELARSHPDRDWILTRILWLTGREPGHNRGGCRDTLRRYIYLHGTPDDQPIGVAASHGCIRMRNQDIVTLFDQVRAGDLVWIGHGLPEPFRPTEQKTR